jgi:hypothetical protein
VQFPEGLTYEDRLVWALHHPDGDRAMVAAQILGQRRAAVAAPALRAVATDGGDPYLAAEALRSLIAIEGSDQIRELLDEPAACDSFMVAGVAARALATSGS